MNKKEKFQEVFKYLNRSIYIKKLDHRDQLENIKRLFKEKFNYEIVGDDNWKYTKTTKTGKIIETVKYIVNVDFYGEKLKLILEQKRTDGKNSICKFEIIE